MKSLAVFLFVGLLVIWMELPSTTGKKPGYCPRDRCRCEGPKPNECRNDYSCRGAKKCCYSCCAMRCVDPVKAKPGYCLTDRCICLRTHRSQCHDDYSCRGTQKCCFSCCKMRCVDPVKEPPLP
ncbi:porwaprin-b-like isoform X2 [Hemicordylus capensis]|uniref:porwaprin-b-like isoform X2 n=1 Tax=Hemicordylus capensis TaxID=884348 RepID=UPI0023042516|nr:porwaprin-b-like isoform X2 [Hemicordylus capensis]